MMLNLHTCTRRIKSRRSWLDPETGQIFAPCVLSFPDTEEL